MGRMSRLKSTFARSATDPADAGATRVHTKDTANIQRMGGVLRCIIGCALLYQAINGVTTSLSPRHGRLERTSKLLATALNLGIVSAVGLFGLSPGKSKGRGSGVSRSSANEGLGQSREISE